MYIDDAYQAVIDIACDQRTSRWLHPLLLLGDMALTVLIVKKIPYTEIDFSTYMQQVQLFLLGVRDYTKLTGSTGPLVYPALHVYIYSFLWWICAQGTSVDRAQVVFAILYIAILHGVITAYRTAEAPPYLLPLLVLSKRLHSVFVLRLFNDCWAAALLWCSILAFQRKRWLMGSFVFSLGVGVKMTLLLALPGVLVVLGTALSVGRTIELLGAMWGVQVLLAVPFITGSGNPGGYMSRAFEFTREFLFKWTVNWRFVGEETFLSKEFSFVLLGVHLLLLAAFGFTRWLRPSGLSLPGHIRRLWSPLPERVQNYLGSQLNPNVIMTIILTSLVIGMLCARSLHYQFFSYLAWTSPFLLWKAHLHPVLIYAVWTLQEWAWNVYPSTNASSMFVVMALALQVLGVWWGTRNEFADVVIPIEDDEELEDKKKS